jgi:hypothetical protein
MPHIAPFLTPVRKEEVTMTKPAHTNRRTFLIACSSVLLLSAVALAFNLNTRNQRAQNSAREEAIRQVNDSPDQFLRILGNDDSPLRIVEARVKEIPGHLFTKLTGRVTELAVVSSLPEVRLLNSSGKTVTRFALIIREPRSQITKGVLQSKIALKPGETYVVKPEHFAGAEKITTADATDARTSSVVPGIDSEKRWMHFAARTDVFITIYRVEFEDGTSWTIKEGGEVR